MNLRRVVLTKLPVGIRARRIEVPERNRPDVVSALEVRQRVLDREFGLSIRIDRSRRVRFAQRRLDRLAVHRAGG
jgi:hypothetical protein